MSLPEAAPTTAYARVLDAAGEVAGLIGDFSTGTRLLEQAAELFHTLQNASEEAHARFHLGQHLWFAGELHAAREAAEQARELSANGVHDLYFALSLYVLGGIAYDEERYADARELGEMILEALGRNALFISAALPARVFPPLFNRYQGVVFDQIGCQLVACVQARMSDTSVLFCKRPRRLLAGPAGHHDRRLRAQ